MHIIYHGLPAFRCPHIIVIKEIYVITHLRTYFYQKENWSKGHTQWDTNFECKFLILGLQLSEIPPPPIICLNMSSVLKRVPVFFGSKERQMIA